MAMSGTYYRYGGPTMPTSAILIIFNMSRSSELSRLASLLVRQSFPRGANGAVLGQQQRSYANSKDGKVLHPDLLNDSVLKTQYAVRGELYLRAEELRKAGKEITFTNGALSMRDLSMLPLVDLIRIPIAVH